MADVKKVYQNTGNRTYQLRAREKGKTHFDFNPGDVISAADAKEEEFFQGHHEIVEFLKPGPTAQERIDALEKENADLRKQLEKAKGK